MAQHDAAFILSRLAHLTRMAGGWGCSSFVAWHHTHTHTQQPHPLAALRPVCALWPLPVALCVRCARCACRLRSRAQSVHDRVYRDAYGCGRRGDAHSTGLMLVGVQDVIDTLAGYR